MQLVVDANVVFSALIADATTRTLLIDLDHEYYTPEFVHTEIRKHRSTIEEKAGVSASAVEIVLDTLFDELVLIPDTDLRPHLQTAHAAIGDTDDLLNYFSQPVVPPQLSLPAIGENLANAFDR
jgi:predicted nucleic acid-binding protein